MDWDGGTIQYTTLFYTVKPRGEGRPKEDKGSPEPSPGAVLLVFLSVWLCMTAVTPHLAVKSRQSEKRLPLHMQLK